MKSMNEKVQRITYFLVQLNPRKIDCTKWTVQTFIFKNYKFDQYFFNIGYEKRFHSI
jgi:hypothetical protein